MDEQIFCFIAFNYFCKARNGTYVPAEVGLIKYSMKCGIIAEYHSLINPLVLPLGMKYEAKKFSEETHNLPPPPNAQGEISMSYIYKKIHHFCYDFEKNEVRPVFTVDNHIPIVDEILKYMASEAGDDIPEIVDVLSLRDVFFNLKNATWNYGGCVTEDFPTIHIAQKHIDRDPYEYNSGIGCELHETLDHSKFCSVSLVKRWAFMFSDHCAVDMGIRLIPGVHVPIKALIPVVKTEYDTIVDNDEEKNPIIKYVVSTSRFFQRGFENSYVRREFKSMSENGLVDSSNVSEVSASTLELNKTGMSNTSGFNRWRRTIPADINDSKPDDKDFYSYLNVSTK